MMKEDLQFQEKDKIFTTYERKSRKHKYGQKKQATENSDEEQQRHYVYIQSLESEEENPVGENGKINEEVNIIFDQQITEIFLELDAQTIERRLQLKKKRKMMEIVPLFLLSLYNKPYKKRRKSA